MGKLHHPDRFKNVSYHHTDLEKTFARIRRQQAEQAAKDKADEAQAATVVRPLVKKAK